MEGTSLRFVHDAHLRRLTHIYSSYFTVIQAGNISFRVALDTASSDLWLLSSDCSSGECPSVPKFPLSYHSPSFGVVNNNETLFNISFADGSGEDHDGIAKPVDRCFTLHRSITRFPRHRSDSMAEFHSPSTSVWYVRNHVRYYIS